MYEIQYGVPQDKKQLKLLYDVCFADDLEFSDWYFENIWDYNNTLVVKTDDKIVSSLQMLPLSFSKGSITLNGCYVFAVCTDPDYRGKGYAGGTIEACFDICISNQYDFCALIVREESLLNFYEKLGFKSVFNVSKIKGYSCAGQVDILSMDDIPDINRIYRFYTDDLISPVRDTNFWQTQMSVYKSYGLKKDGKLINYCFGDVRNGEFYCVEALGDSLDELCSYAAYCEGTTEYTMLSTPSSDMATIGCIKTLSYEAKLLFNDNATGYLNLYFN